MLRSGWALGFFVLLLGSGCVLPATPQDPAPRGVEALAGEELVLGAPRDESPSYITNLRQLKLRYDTGGAWLPAQVRFEVRRADERGWRAGPTWQPGEAAPLWSPPRDGRWLVRAVAEVDSAAPDGSGGVPVVSVTFDWTPPALNVGEKLPGDPLAGGEHIPLRWHVGDDHLGSQRVTLEVQEARDGPWQRVTELPNTGQFDWEIPNRPFAGARVRLRVEDVAGNSTTVRVPGTLTVQSLVPKVSVPSDMRSNREIVSIPYEVTTPGGTELERVELWITNDGGDNWRLAGYDEDLVSPFDQLFDEGRWGFRIVAHDRLGNRSVYPAPGDEPHGQLIVDWTAPEVIWGDVDVRLTDDTDVTGDSRIEVRVPFRVRDFEVEETSIEVAYRPEAGEWQTLRRSYRRSDEIRVRVPESVPQPLVIRVSGRDRSANGFAEETAVYPREVLYPPELGFTEPPRGWLQPGRQARIRYHARWEAGLENGVELAYSENGRDWETLADALPEQGEHLWTVPSLTSDSIVLRLIVHGRNGRRLEAWSEHTFGVDGEAPSAHLLGPNHGFGESMTMLVEGADRGGSDIAFYDLFARAVGSDVWERAGGGAEKSGRRAVTLLPLPPGSYHLWVVAEDRAGNRSPGPELASADQLLAFTVEDRPPGVRLSSFQEGGVFAGASQHLVFWSWAGQRPVGGVVRLELSTDDGGSWRPIAKVPVSEDRYSWTLPDENSTQCRLRAVAESVTGERTVDQSRMPFAVDAEAPVVTVKSLRPGGGKLSSIAFDVRDPGGSGCERVWLFTSTNGGETWVRTKRSFPAISPLEVELTAGDYGFVLRGEDRVGNVALPPPSGARPEFTAKVWHGAGVELAILHPKAGVLAGGTRHYVFWTLDAAGAPFADLPVKLEYRLSGADAWRPIATDLPAEGKQAWVIPDREGERIELRAVAFDLDGNRYEGAVPGAIFVDSSVPTVVLAGPGAANRRPVEVDYRVSDGDSLRSVELWMRAVSTPTWKLVGEAKVGERLTVDVPDAMYRVAFVGVDEAGNRGRPPAPGSRGSGDLLVDTVPPLLDVDGLGAAGVRERLFHEGEWVKIRPRVQDRHLSSFPVAFRYSADGGKTFQQLKRYHPNGDEFPWRLPKKPGTYYLEVTAEDLAGNATRQVVPIQVIAVPPKVTLLEDPTGAILAGGDELRLEWETTGVEPLHRGMVIEFSRDMKLWETVRKGLPADGSLVWKLPRIDSNRCRLRFTLTRPDGLTGRAWSGTFTVSTTPPKVELDGVESVPD